tara:strand:- start:2082 stop:2267 length:186 start_codon:yes stop_codon:yes gene_type:complete
MITKSNKKTEKEAKEHISYLRNFSQGTMPINILVNKNEEDIYKKVMKKMRKVSNLSIKVRD